MFIHRREKKIKAAFTYTGEGGLAPQAHFGGGVGPPKNIFVKFGLFHQKKDIKLG